MAVNWIDRRILTNFNAAPTAARMRKRENQGRLTLSLKISHDASANQHAGMRRRWKPSKKKISLECY